VLKQQNNFSFLFIFYSLNAGWAPQILSIFNILNILNIFKFLNKIKSKIMTVYIKPIRFIGEFTEPAVKLYDFEISTEPREGFERLESVEKKYIRDFSVGYSESKVKQLQSKFALYDIFSIKDNNVVTLCERGTRNTLGAYGRGYYSIEVRINGKISANHQGMFNKNVDDLLKKVYRLQKEYINK
jgi:hypothetical protein